MPPGTQVRSKADPSLTGVITNAPPRTVASRVRYQVRWGNGTLTWIPEEALEEIGTHVDPLDDIRQGRFQGPPSLRRNLANEKLNGRLSNVI